MRIVWRRQARDDLLALRAYIARDNPRAAARIGRAILIAVDRLVLLPRLGRPGRVADTRELVVPRTPSGQSFAASASWPSFELLPRPYEPASNPLRLP